MTTRVFIADETPFIRDLLQQILREASPKEGVYEVVGTAAKLEHVVGFVLRHQPEVLLLEYQESSFSSIVECVRAGLDTPPYILGILDVGESCLLPKLCERLVPQCLLKPLAPGAVIHNINRVLDGTYVVGPQRIGGEATTVISFSP